MWNRGGFSEKLVNNSALYNPWASTGQKNTPFDKSFYLILNVAVGGTNGFFPEGVGNKPWGNASPTVSEHKRITDPATLANNRSGAQGIL
jgi:hypothetical protein